MLKIFREKRVEYFVVASNRSLPKHQGFRTAEYSTFYFLKLKTQYA